MPLETNAEDTSAPPSPAKTPMTITLATPCPTTPSPTKKRGPTTPLSLYPSKKHATASQKPDPDLATPHAFWVTVWFNGERTIDLATAKTHVNLAAIKATGYITTCQVIQNVGLSCVFTDDSLWLKATLVYPPSVAADLLGSPIVATSQSVVLFTPFPCSTNSISIKELDHLQERRSTTSLVTNDFKAHAIIPGGRPYTWSRSRLIELNLRIQDNETHRVENPTKHILQELIEMMERMDTHDDT